MGKRVQVVEIVADDDLKKKEARASEAFRRYFPDAPPLRLYRTGDGRIGFQVQLAVAAGERDRLSRAYSAVQEVVGNGRGRRSGPPKVQAKLRLRVPVHRALKRAAKKAGTTVSGLVEELAEKAGLL